jgi:hypothetical protein
VLQFYYIPFGVCDINECNHPSARNLCRNEFTDGPAACGDYRVSGDFDVINREGDMRKTGTIDRSFLSFLLVVVLKYFEPGTLIAIAREPQLNPVDPGIGNPSAIFKPFTGKLSFRWNWRASENSFIELSESPPVLSNDVSVDESRVHSNMSPPLKGAA